MCENCGHQDIVHIENECNIPACGCIEYIDRTTEIINLKEQLQVLQEGVAGTKPDAGAVLNVVDGEFTWVVEE